MSIIRGSAAQDVLIINSRNFLDFAGAEPIVLDISEDGADIKKYKNGNIITTWKPSGDIATLTIKLMVASDDDKFLNALHKSWRSNPTQFTFLSGQFIKRLADGNGNLVEAIYNLNAGMFLKQVPMKENVESDVETAIATWSFKFDVGTGRDIL